MSFQAASYALKLIIFQDIADAGLVGQRSSAGEPQWLETQESMEPCIAAVHNPTQGRAFSFGDGNRSRESEPNAANRVFALFTNPE
jgi:hypothetical protein